MSSTKQQQELSLQQQQALLRQQALRGALKNSHETQEIAHDTSAALSRQGEQISRVSKKLDGMEKDLQTSDFHTRTIGSWFGQMWNAIRGAPSAGTDVAKSGEKAKEAENIAIANQLDQSRGVAQSQQDLLKKRIAKDNGDKKQQQEKKSQTGEEQGAEGKGKNFHDDIEEDLLDQLQASVHGVMHSAKVQNSTIRAQNVALDETNEKLDQVHGHMRQTTKKINRLI